jgi:predicted transcriptional regulator
MARSDRSGVKTVPLGALELAIMNFVWDLGKSVTVPEIHAGLSEHRKLAYTTTMTVTARLADKGLLGRSRESRPYRYWAALDREEYSAGLMLAVLSELGNGRATLARFVERIRREDAELLDELRRTLRSRHP